MRRYWLEDFESDAEELSIDGDVFHHIVHVCRRKSGDKFEILKGDGLAYFVSLGEVGNKSASLKILEKRKLSPLKTPYIHLVLSAPKSQTFDTILEKSVELGVHTLHPVVSDFSFFKEKSHKALSKVDRWSKIITSACQQSARGEKLNLEPVSTLVDKLEDFNRNTNAMGLFAYEGEASLGWKEALQALKKTEKNEIWLFVGSEGGFSDQEVEIFKSFGLVATSMGDQVLRVETACLALISSIKYEFSL